MGKRSKRINLKPPGKCIFDGKLGLTKAHIFPEWLGEHITEKTDRHVHAVGNFETFTPRTQTPAAWTRIRQGDTGSRKVRRVCGGCNSGWLGALETPAKPIVVALMNGEDVVIDLQMQRNLAAWLCAITMLIDADNPPEGSAVPQSHRDYFRGHRTPPPMWKVWIAKYRGTNWQDHRVRRTGMNVQPMPEVNGNRFTCNTQVTTLVIRYLCAHVFSSTVFELPGYEGVNLQQIWPSTGENFVWSRAPILDDGGVIVLSEALARDLTPIP